MSDDSTSGITLLPYSTDSLEYLCEHIAEKYQKQLPDLSRLIILMPDGEARQRLSRILLEKLPTDAILAPRVMTLHQLVHEYTDSEYSCISLHARELLLVEALREHSQLYGKSNPWLLAENLLQLFDGLNRQQQHLPDNFEAFTDILEKAYGFDQSASEQLSPLLNHEAELVYTLWQAWQEQLANEGLRDPADDYCQRLANLNIPEQFQHCYIVGHSHFIPAETTWFCRMAQSGKASLIVQGHSGGNKADYHPDGYVGSMLESMSDIGINEPLKNDLYSQTLDSIFTQDEEAIAQRAQTFAGKVSKSPLKGRIEILSANNPEQEALGIELQVRLWLSENIGQIGIICQDRRLARRLRALFERSDIQLQVQSGWALSTTSAAAVLERWLECIEQDFEQLPLLDLLKSPLLVDEKEREIHLKTIYRFEQDIILRENISSGLKRYSRQLDIRHKRLPEIWTLDMTDALHGLFNKLEHAASPLLSMMGKKNLQPMTFINALQESMQRIGLLDAFAVDIAGQKIIAELESMAQSLDGRKLVMHWGELRSWLGRTLERYNFCPQTMQSRVQLLDINNSALSHFDALIIAAANHEHLPCRNEPSAFFNDAVKQALNLEVGTEKQRQQFYYFRCLLESSPKLLLSYHHEKNGEAIAASPWLAAIQNFHQLAWGDNLEAETLHSILNAGYRGFNHSLSISANSPVHAQPRAVCPTHLIPNTISASGYQQLIDCPYQFFLARCLSLKASEEVKTALEKSDYGQRIHLCLQVFHSQVDDYPAPFAQTLNDETRQAAEEHLDEISQNVFARDLEDNFQHRGWLRRWQQTIPLYIDWQIKREHSWRFSQAELTADSSLPAQELVGRLDRLDQAIDNEHYGIIDYKTGYTPKQADVDNGEAVQLPFYALLLGEHIQRVEYLLVDKEVKTKASLEAEALDDLRQRQQHRLTDIIEALHNGQEMPAWGDDTTCGYCDMHGLCRRDAWQDDELGGEK